MTEYRWGTWTAVDYFCPVCGILPFRKPSALTESERKQGAEAFDGWSINARCIHGLDLAALQHVMIEGSKLNI